MFKFIHNTVSMAKKGVRAMKQHAKKGLALVGVGLLSTANAAAQALANTGYDAGTSALEEVATEITKYVPYVVNLCYALAGVVAVVGAISVYIAMSAPVLA